MTEVNLNALLEIASANKTSENIFTLFSQRKRMRFETDLNSLKRLLITKYGNLNDEHFYETFKKLAEIGICLIIKSDKGLPSRIKWRYNLKDMAHSVAGTNKKPLQSVKKKETPTKKEPEAQKEYIGIIKRGDLVIEVKFKTLQELAECVKKIA